MLEKNPRLAAKIKRLFSAYLRLYVFCPSESTPAVKILLASVSPRKTSKNDACESLVRDYITRASRFSTLGIPHVEATIFPTEAALLESAARAPSRAAATLILCDSTGEQLTSPQFAEALRRLRDDSTPRLILAIGPADGWSPSARAAAARTLSFGRITLPHELARVILAEQLYRALTILAGHPYHSGH
jgi:23S rRNA (pseudouridine1915-N3)-methyltransferase